MAHAQLDEYYVQHLHLLTRNEIIVFIYLLRRRNDKSKQCNPKQATIVRDTNLLKSRVSEAIEGLETKGWVVWTKNGEFIFPKTVSETPMKSSVLRNNKSYAKRNLELRKTELGVTQNGTLLNKDIEQTFEQTSEQAEVGAKKNYGTPFDSLSQLPANADAHSALSLWLDRIAQTLGAANRHTMADYEKWEKVCMKAIDEGREIDAMIEVVKSEQIRLAETPHFFSPNNVLKQLQISSARPKPPQPIIAADYSPELERELNRKARIEKEGINDSNRQYYNETLANIQKLQELAYAN